MASPYFPMAGGARHPGEISRQLSAEPEQVLWTRNPTPQPGILSFNSKVYINYLYISHNQAFRSINKWVP